MKIQILVDNPNSWITPYLKNLVSSIKQKKNCYVKLINSHEDVESGDVLCLLSCEKKFNKLNLNKYNLVVHESDLPEGKGWSPLTWQVIEGKRNIPITLFEANSLIDSGNIYGQDFIELNGSELLSEIKEQQAELAKEAGINAFCYWHYWLGNGNRLLNQPFDQVINSGKPDFPFCLGWANHHWQRKDWNSESNFIVKETLAKQEYGGILDYTKHFNDMLPAFSDDRYYKIDGRRLGKNFNISSNFFINGWICYIS